MKTAFTYWEDRIAPVFDTARQIHIVESASGKIVGETHEMLPEDLPAQKVIRLVELGISTLVCGAVSRPLHEMVSAYGIQVFPFVAGDLREVIEAWLKKGLGNDCFAMPGCCGRGPRRKMHGMNKGEFQINGRKRGGMGSRYGQGRSRMDGPLAEGCLCPKCGHIEPHERGVPCVQKQCPKCGTSLNRA